MRQNEREVYKALDGLIVPCDCDLHIDSHGYTLKTDTIDDLVTMSTFIKGAVDGKSKKLSESSVKVVVDTSMLCETMRDMRERVDEVVKNIGDHFTDGGTSKEPVKIPDNKYWAFVNSLRESSKKKLSLNKTMYLRWNIDGEYTKCFVEYNDMLYIGNATKHPDDVENEYIGKSLSFNRAFDKLEKAVLGIEDEKVVGTALTMALEDNYVNVGRNGSITRCIAGVDVDRGDVVYVGHGGRVYPANSKQRGYRGGRIEDSKINAEKIVVGFDFASGEIVYMDTDSFLWKSKNKAETKSESMPNLTPIYDDITITMTREQAEDVLKTLKDNPGNINTYWDLHEKMGV